MKAIFSSLKLVDDFLTINLVIVSGLAGKVCRDKMLNYSTAVFSVTLTSNGDGGTS